MSHDEHKVKWTTTKHTDSHELSQHSEHTEKALDKNEARRGKK
jgi:hypothetical protein